MARLKCWHCGKALVGINLPIKHFDLCPTCREELHCCSMCRSYAPELGGSRCRKEEADYVTNKRRANYCHYFQASSHAFKGAAAGDNLHRNALDALFGGGEDEDAPSETTAPRYEKQSQASQQGLAELFGEAAADDAHLSAEQKAAQELEKLFGKKTD